MLEFKYTFSSKKQFLTNEEKYISEIVKGGGVSRPRWGWNVRYYLEE